MNTTKTQLKNLLPAVALAFLVTAGMPAVAFARGGDSTTTSSTTSGSGTSGTSGTSSSTEVAHTESTTETQAVHTESSNISETSGSTRSEHRAEAEVEVHKMRSEKKPQQTDTERTKKCEDRKEGLQNKFDSIARNSANYQTRIDDIYAKTVAFQTTNNLNPTGLSALIATANAAKAKAALSVAGLQTSKPTSVDCTNKTVATDVAAFKISASQARTDLKAYKQAVKAVVKSLRDASKAITQSTETQTETEKTKPTTTTEGTN